MPHFFFRLNGPRPTFPGDITDDETRTMREHAAYTQSQCEAGRVLAYGPVFTSEGAAFGMALLEVEDEAAARAFAEADPSIAGGLNTFEIFPMRLFQAPPREHAST